MAHHVVLNNLDHRELRVVTTRSAARGDAVMAALTFPGEFRNLQAHYPIVFQKTAEGSSFQPIALLGLREGQNLFLRVDGHWDAPCLPLAIERQPFLIGFDDAGEPVIHVDLDSPRIAGPGEDGEPLFLPYGGNSEHLERIASVLQALHDGLQRNPAFVDALLRHELLEPFALEYEAADGTPRRWSGFYTIHEERLARLGADALGALNAAGHLLPIYMALASTARFRDLIECARGRAA